MAISHNNYVSCVIHNMGLHNTFAYHASLGPMVQQGTKGAPRETADWLRYAPLAAAKGCYLCNSCAALRVVASTGV
jgi:hypothetical protein